MREEILFTWAVKATLVLVAASCLCAAMRKASAAARHLVWTVAFAALLLLPVLSQVTPGWTAPVRAPYEFTGQAPHPTPARPLEPSPVGFDWIPILWLLGAIGVLARFAAGTARVWTRVRRARPMCIDGVSCGVRILDAGPGAMPMTWGILRPVILLPSEATAWPAEWVRIVLLHELAHVARLDCLTLAIAELALALYWFHPLAWWAASCMRRERERACDDRVLAAGIMASDYAGDLVHIARGRSDSLTVAPAMARGSNLESRLKCILDPNIRRRAVTRKVAAAASAAALMVMLPLASLRLLGQGGGLTGVVYDPRGAVVPHAEVSVASAGFTKTIVSGPDGTYSFPDLSAGRYQLMVRIPGFQLYVREVISVPAAMDVVLSLGSREESMTVSGKRPIVTPNASPRRIRVGGNVQVAKIVIAPKPIYPPQAEAAGVQGKVLLSAVVGLDGSIGGLSVLLSPDPQLAGAALDAVRQWRYQPTLLNGEPVEVVTTISVNFRLDQ